MTIAIPLIPLLHTVTINSSFLFLVASGLQATCNAPAPSIASPLQGVPDGHRKQCSTGGASTRDTATHHSTIRKAHPMDPGHPEPKRSTTGGQTGGQGLLKPPKLFSLATRRPKRSPLQARLGTEVSAKSAKCGVKSFGFGPQMGRGRRSRRSRGMSWRNLDW